MKRLSWGAWCLVAGAALFAVTLCTPAWRWAIRGQMDCLFGRVRARPLSVRRTTLAGALREGRPTDLLVRGDKDRDYGDAPLFRSPGNVEEQVANALWTPDPDACRAKLRSIAESNPRSLLAQAMVAGDVGPVRYAPSLAKDSARFPRGSSQSPKAISAAARRGAAVDPDNAFWPLAQVSRYARPGPGPLCEALVRAGKAKRFEHPDTGYALWFGRAVLAHLGRGYGAAAYSGGAERLRGFLLPSPRAVEALGDDKKCLEARLGLLKSAQLLSETGDGIEIMIADLDAGLATVSRRGSRPRVNKSALDAPRDFERRVVAAGIDLGGFDVVRSLQEHWRLHQAGSALLKAEHHDPEPNTDFDLLGAAILLIAAVAVPSALIAILVQSARSRKEFRRFSPTIVAGVAAAAVAFGADGLAWPAAGLLLGAATLLALGRRTPAIAVGGVALVSCMVGAFVHPVLAVPGVALLLVWIGNVLPERKWLSASLGMLLVAALVAIAGCWVALRLIDFTVSPIWTLAAFAGVLALIPQGRTKALQWAGPVILLCAVAHAAFLAADIRHDGYYARFFEGGRDGFADRVRAKAATLPLPVSP